MRKKGLFSLLALFFAFALIAAACGSDDDGGSDESSGDSTTTTAASDDEGGDAAQNTGDGTFTVGTLLPETGSLAFLGPPEFAGVDLAVADINEAGGVNGEEIPDAIQGDSGDTSTDIASQTADRLLSENADLIVGAASSGVSLTVIDKITGAGVIQFSPANTAPDFTDYDDNGLYFRTAPSDVLQGQLLGELIAGDGNATLGILALDDPYGTGLAEFVTQSFTDSGGEVVETVIYDPNATNFDAEVQQVADAQPDAVIVIGFDESARILTSMIEKGIGPSDIPVYGTDGNMGNALAEQFDDPSQIAGMKGTTPLTDLSSDFTDRLDEVDPNLEDYNYAGESYDAVIITALAADIAGTDNPTEVAAEINGVTKDGEVCTTYADCLALVEDGTDIDYDGISGPLSFGDAGEPSEASFGILVFGDEGIDDAQTTFEFAQI
jgi:branched-chain amino acid transport system substrate-binding protein